MMTTKLVCVERSVMLNVSQLVGEHGIALCGREHIEQTLRKDDAGVSAKATPNEKALGVPL